MFVCSNVYNGICRKVAFGPLICWRSCNFNSSSQFSLFCVNSFLSFNDKRRTHRVGYFKLFKLLRKHSFPGWNWTKTFQFQSLSIKSRRIKSLFDMFDQFFCTVLILHSFHLFRLLLVGRSVGPFVTISHNGG